MCRKHQTKLKMVLAGLAAALFCSCAAETAVPPASATSGVQDETVVSDTHRTQENFIGTGSVLCSEEAQLTEAQQQPLTEYLSIYYEALARLAPDEQFRTLFIDETQGLAHEAMMEYIIGVRSLQQVDLSLTNYSYTLECQNIEAEGNGDLTIFAYESGVLNFSAYPGVDSEYFHVPHRFVLTETNQGWRIKSHVQWDTLYYMATGADFWRERQIAEPAVYFTENVEALLNKAQEYLESRTTGESPVLPAAQPYDRQAAVEYANHWVEDRSSEWADYGRSGGNCQNYVSQCLLAGGIPMDVYGGQVWKWYGDTPNNNAGNRGRSASWSGVEEFRSYARENTGYGLVAWADAPYLTGEPGDLIHMGTEDGWHHTVVIVAVKTDAAGKTQDYLVDSNTADLRNWPASAYHYVRQELTKIYGWNDLQ